MYYLHESNLLRGYEQRVADKVPILAVSEKDKEDYQKDFGARDISVLPVFLPFEEVRSKEGTGCFCLYLGNLSVAEKEQAVIWLLKYIFHSLTLPLILSGNNPSSPLPPSLHQT